MAKSLLTTVSIHCLPVTMAEQAVGFKVQKLLHDHLQLGKATLNNTSIYINWRNNPHLMLEIAERKLARRIAHDSKKHPFSKHCFKSSAHLISILWIRVALINLILSHACTCTFMDSILETSLKNWSIIHRLFQWFPFASPIHAWLSEPSKPLGVVLIVDLFEEFRHDFPTFLTFRRGISNPPGMATFRPSSLGRKRD